MSELIKTKTAKELLSTAFPPSEMLVDGVIPQGIAILAGPQKVGKSFLALDICCSIATGASVLGRETVQGECLYLGLEDTYRRLQSRLLLMNAEGSDSLHFAIAADKIGGGLEGQIEEFSNEHPNLRLVVVDVMQLARKNAKASYSAEYSELAGLRDLANNLGICIMLVMHMRKSRDRDPLNNIYGGGGFVASADAILMLTEERRGSGKGALFCTGREISSTELAVFFDKETMRWCVIKDPAANNNGENKTLAAVYVFIRKKKHFEGSATELIEELKSVTSDVFHPNRITRDLLEQGHQLVYHGILFAVKRNHQGRIIILHYTKDDNDESTVTRALLTR
ncbi:AAA family ATPase [uncultured Ruminococcus sp.]|uniref:AAA family ATPase n=1 Tax=uncultured Ruminococcus sp. TaxID=165186 RepID=UPI0025F86163|nr:AAA family ATPase [uncultured Ruminococcus sp.]